MDSILVAKASGTAPMTQLISITYKYCSCMLCIRFRVMRPVGILVIGEGRKGGRDKIGQNSGLCEHL
jgi:hypothetical protein